MLIKKNYKLGVELRDDLWKSDGKQNEAGELGEEDGKRPKTERPGGHTGPQGKDLGVEASCSLYVFYLVFKNPIFYF